MEQLTLNVTGMTCGGCEAAVKRALSRIDGVSSTTASHAENRVTIEYDATKTDVAQITRAIETAGYRVAA
jgi:copper chaperone